MKPGTLCKKRTYAATAYYFYDKKDYMMFISSYRYNKKLTNDDIFMFIEYVKNGHDLFVSGAKVKMLAEILATEEELKGQNFVKIFINNKIAYVRDFSIEAIEMQNHV